MTSDLEANLEGLFALFEKYGAEEYGEHVNQIQHAVQAAELAEADGHDEETILAALLHDIGHLYGRQLEQEQMDQFGVVDHEDLGASYLLELGFSEKMAGLVQSHVAAKRYLTARRPGYYEALSEASKETLRFQGGPMSESEADAFEAQPEFELMIRMREWDEEAKHPDRVPAPLDRYRAMARRVLLRGDEA